MSQPYISPKTTEKIAAPTPVGTRHHTAMEIALDMIGNGFSQTAVFETLRAKFDSSVTDKELQDIVHWATDKHPTESVPIKRQMAFQTKTPKVRTPNEHANWWLSGKTMGVGEFSELSQLAIPDKPCDQTRLVLEMLYEGPENVNVVCMFSERDGKATPNGGGRIMTRDNWLDYLTNKGVPESKAGAWFRFNPCSAKGSGAGGAVTDSDIVSHKFLLLESDVLPLETQLALFSKIKLPIALVVLSGGMSAHAWVNLDCENAKQYSERAKKILSILAPFGIDQANKNASRLSRLPGAKRVIGAKGDGLQKLLWLNPAKESFSESALELFEDSMDMPAIEEKPFKSIVKEALQRYQEMRENPDRDKIPTGISDYDRDNGGHMRGQMMVISSETGTGKSSMAMNMANAALRGGKSIALFTLEMGNQEIADLMFSMNCKIDRNKFNTYKFSDQDIDAMVKESQKMMNVPFWSYDDSQMTADQIRKRVLQLKREFDISLVIVDYAQIVTSADDFTPREQQVARIARALCALAKDAKVAMVVLSQLNDDGKLRESRVIGHEAHIVVSLENRENENRIIFHVVKGRRVQKKNYVLHYEPQYCKIGSESKIKEEDIPKTRATIPDP